MGKLNKNVKSQVSFSWDREGLSPGWTFKVNVIASIFFSNSNKTIGGFIETNETPLANSSAIIAIKRYI